MNHQSSINQPIKLPINQPDKQSIKQASNQSFIYINRAAVACIFGACITCAWNAHPGEVLETNIPIQYLSDCGRFIKRPATVVLPRSAKTEKSKEDAKDKLAGSDGSASTVPKK